MTDKNKSRKKLLEEVWAIQTVPCFKCGYPLSTKTLNDGTKMASGENVCWSCFSGGGPIKRNPQGEPD